MMAPFAFKRRALQIWPQTPRRYFSSRRCLKVGNPPTLHSASLQRPRFSNVRLLFVHFCQANGAREGRPGSEVDIFPMQRRALTCKCKAARRSAGGGVARSKQVRAAHLRARTCAEVTLTSAGGALAAKRETGSQGRHLIFGGSEQPAAAEISG